MFECGFCTRAFPSGWRARENHCAATGHHRPQFECDTCGAYCNTENERWQHMLQSNHFFWQCDKCDHIWPTEQQLKDHVVNDHWYCSECKRPFQSQNNIKMHLNSRTHRGQAIECPFCKTPFATATGMLHHLEGGFCPRAHNLNRDEIYRFVRSKDPSGLISKKLIGWTGESDVQYEASNQAWNGRAFECYFCHKSFGALNSLNQHLNSGAHRQDLYHCPKPDCRRDFRTLAAIINHLESESCGMIRFESVQKQIAGLVSDHRMLSFH